MIAVDWHEVLHLEVPGQPVGASRPRFQRRGQHVHTHMPDAMIAAERWILDYARRAWGDRAPLDEPVRFRLIAVLERPKAMIPRRSGGSLSGPAEERLAADLGPVAGRLLAQCKPDIDNVAKLAMDGVVKAGVLRDDTRVVELLGRKVYAALGEQPCTVVTVYVRGKAG